jgi:hypothetical protein
MKHELFGLAIVSQFLRRQRTGQPDPQTGLNRRALWGGSDERGKKRGFIAVAAISPATPFSFGDSERSRPGLAATVAFHISISPVRRGCAAGLIAPPAHRPRQRPFVLPCSWSSPSARARRDALAPALNVPARERWRAAALDLAAGEECVELGVSVVDADLHAG